ncbi:MAG TPA: hypothetical protein VHS28_03925, partial [Chloroflexota bacterium]|nr:hypothetical protein [Chloroflexota bacterium]
MNGHRGHGTLARIARQIPAGAVATIDSAGGDSRAAGASGWSHWWQREWSGGDGQLIWDAEGPAGRWHTGYGVEVTTAGVRLGPATSRDFLSTEDGFAAMLPFGGKLYASSVSSGAIYCCDGSGWDLACDTGKDSMASMAVHQGCLYVGSG